MRSIPTRPSVRRQPPSSGASRLHFYRGAVLLSLGIFIVWMNSGFLVPLAMGAIFAVVLYPTMQGSWLFALSPLGRALLITFAFAFSFLLPIGAVIFMAAEEALSRLQPLLAASPNVPLSVPEALHALGVESWISRLAALSPMSEDQIRQLASRTVLSGGTWLVGVLQGLLASVPNALFANVITLLAMFYFLIDGPIAVRFFRENSFFNRDETERILKSVSALCYSVVVASIAAGAVQASLIVIACLITGTSNPVLIGLVAFILSFLPVIGTLPLTFGLALLSLVSGSLFGAGIFVVFILLVGLSDNIVRPWVLRGGASLHPLIGFVAAFGALDSIGFYGVFIGPVVAGVFFTLLPMVARHYRARVSSI